MDNKLTRSLVKSAQKRNRNAFFQLTELYIGAVYALCLRIFAEKKIANTITKSVFILAWKDIKNLRENDSFQYWLRGITIYKTLEEIRNNLDIYKTNRDNTISEETELLSKIQIDEKLSRTNLIDRLLLVFYDIEGYTFEETYELLMGFEINKDEEIISKARKRFLLLSERKCEKNSIPLEYYYQNLLSANESNRVEQHLLSCKKCQYEFNKLKDYFVQLDAIPVSIEPPPNLFKIIYEEISSTSAVEIQEMDSLISQEKLVKLKKEKDEEEKREKAKLRKFKKQQKLKEKKVSFIPSMNFLKKLSKKSYKYILLGTSVVLVLIFLYIFFNDTTPWQIKVNKGSYLILPANKQIDVIDKNEKIKTFDESQVEIFIHDIGKLVVLSNSEVSVIKSTPKDIIIKLHVGTIKLQLWKVNEIFKVRTKNYTISANQAVFDCQIDNLNNFTVEVEEGIVELSDKNVKFNVPNFYRYDVKFGAIRNIPTSIYASVEFIEAFEKYLYQNGGDDAINQIIITSQEYDAVTLWHLLSVVPANRVADIYERINMFYPVPTGIKKDDILSLKPDALKMWWEEIEWRL